VSYFPNSGFALAALQLRKITNECRWNVLPFRKFLPESSW
jgi:hypothetical protein